jgi:hypothetical protein
MRWLSELLRNEFSAHLNGAQILQLKDFQEVVAKGLAVECARRSFTEDRQGDFAAVTYNRLCCILDPDDAGMELKRFIPRDDALPKVDVPGVLLPSASVIRQFQGKPMRWRVHLDRAPRQRLNYYFLRSSFDPDDIPNLQNIEEHTAHTPRNCTHDQHLTLDLAIAEDGTATPTFIYKLGRSEKETIAKLGKPFYLDMTTGDTASVGTAYVGIDFGTSNTSISYVDSAAIQVFTRRSDEKYWSELSDLSMSLPYPLASVLANYLCQTDQARLATAARDFLESALTLAAYIAYIDHCTDLGRAEARLFKGLTKRSAGPLWKLFLDSMKQTNGKRIVSTGYGALLDSELGEEISRAVTIVAEYKHGKHSDSTANVTRAVEIMANVSHNVFQEFVFGYFQQVQKQRFAKTYEGAFRHAHGRPPFVQVSKYEGTIAFSDNETYMVNRTTGRAVSLEPLILWAQCPQHRDLENGHCYMYDSTERDGAFTFKAVGFPCVLKANASGAFSELASQLNTMASLDRPFYPVEVKID